MNPTYARPSSFDLKEIGKKAAQEAEKEIITATLKLTHWNRKKAAKLLKVSYKALLYKIQQYRIEGGAPLEKKTELSN